MILTVDSAPSPIQLGNTAACLSFPLCCTFSLCLFKYMLAGGVGQTPLSMNKLLWGCFFSPSVTTFMNMGWFTVVGKG